MASPSSDIRVTGIGSWPGTRLEAAAREIVDVAGELTFVPELPATGADMISRALAEESPWVLPDVPLADSLQVSVCGPTTLAVATGMSTADAVAHLRARLPRWIDDVGHPVILQVDEPIIPVPSAVADVLSVHHGPTVVHSCARPAPVEELAATGAHAMAIDLSIAGATWHPSWRDMGNRAWLGIMPTRGPIPRRWDDVSPQVRAEVQRRLAAGIPVVLTPSCGLGLSPDAVERWAALHDLARQAAGDGRLA